MQIRKSPFDNQLVIAGTHHKSGTLWFMSIFEKIANEYGLNYWAGPVATDTSGLDLHLSWRSEFNFDHLRPYKGVHIIRDPRDMIVSGYYYHLHTDEEWVHKPSSPNDRRTYQQRLLEADKTQGLLLEIENFKPIFARMQAWNYASPMFIEVKYEDLISNEEDVFLRIFSHLGAQSAELGRLVNLALECSFQNITGRKIGEAMEGKHRRSGKPGQWQTEFCNAHIELFNTLYPNLLKSLNYRDF